MVRPASIEPVPGAATTRPTPAGAAGTQLQAGFLLYDDPNPETRGPLWYGDGSRNGLVWQMVRDPLMRLCIEARVTPLLAARWDVQPANESPLATEIADYVRWNFFELLDWHKFIHTGSVGYTRDGFSLHEFTDDILPLPPGRFPLHPQPQAGVVYTGVHHRPAFTKYQWIQSKADSTRIAGVVQKILGSDSEEPGLRTISLEEGALLFRISWEQEGADFDGFPIARSSYGPFKEKRMLKVVLMIYYERAGNALPKISEPDPQQHGGSSDQSERDVAAEILRNVRVHEQGYLRLPPGWEFDWSQPGKAPERVLEAIENANRDMALPFNVAWMLLSSGGTAGTVGSRALASEQRGQYVLDSEKQARTWEYALNVGQDGWSPVRRVVVKNYGANAPVPRILVRSMPLRDLKDKLSVLPQLVQSGVLVMDEPARAHVRVELDFPKADPATATPYKPTAPATPAAAPSDDPPSDNEQPDEAPAPADDAPAEAP